MNDKNSHQLDNFPNSLLATIEHKNNLYNHLQSNFLELVEEKKNNQLALKKIKKETSKALSQLKYEIDYLRRSIMKDKQNNLRTTKRIQFLKESIKQIEQTCIDLEVKEKNLTVEYKNYEEEIKSQLEELEKHKKDYEIEKDKKRERIDIQKNKLYELKQTIAILQQENNHLKMVEIEKIKKMINQVKTQDIPKLEQDINQYQKDNLTLNQTTHENFSKENSVDMTLQDKLEQIQEINENILQIKNKNDLLSTTLLQEQKFKEELKQELKKLDKI